MSGYSDKRIVTAIIAGGIIMTSALVLPSCTPKTTPSDSPAPVIKNSSGNQETEEPSDLYGPAESWRVDEDDLISPLYGPSE